MTAIPLSYSSQPSRYVKRCVRCKTVRGNSQFGGKPGDRADVCRFCAEAENERAKKLRADVKKLTKFRVTERRLTRELEKLRLKIRTLEYEAIAAEQESLF